MTPQALSDALLHASRQMVASEPILTQADQAIGDGDHGIGMKRGFEAVIAKLEGGEAEAVDAVLKAAGMALMGAVGGASGAVFGTLFRGGGKSLAGAAEFDAGALATFLADGLAAVQARGNAKPGDKTMVDALAPAAEAAAAVATTGAPLAEALAAAAEGARAGVEKTKEMVATTGKAKTLGERSLGHPDPGALSLSIILGALAEAGAQG